MVWVILVLGAVGWFVVTLIFEKEKGASQSISSRISALPRWLREELRALRASVASRRRAAPSFRVGPTSRQLDTERAVPGEGWRSRVVALIELILFVVLISALFAGAIAAATLAVGHLGA
jgi:hypothetical protein